MHFFRSKHFRSKRLKWCVAQKKFLGSYYFGGQGGGRELSPFFSHFSVSSNFSSSKVIIVYSPIDLDRVRTPEYNNTCTPDGHMCSHSLAITINWIWNISHISSLNLRCHFLLVIFLLFLLSSRKYTVIGVEIWTRLKFIVYASLNSPFHTFSVELIFRRVNFSTKNWMILQIMCCLHLTTVWIDGIFDGI